MPPVTPEKRTVNNVIWDHVLDPLHDYLADKFKGRTEVRWDREIERGDYYQIGISSPSSVFIGRPTEMESRRYFVTIDYIRRIGGESGLPMLKRVTQRVEDMQNVLDQILDYTPDGVYKWHGGQLESVDYGAADPEEEEKKWIRVRMILSVVVTEPIS